MKPFLSILLLLPSTVIAQDITIPTSVSVKTGRLATIVISSSLKSIVWLVTPSGDIDSFQEYNPNDLPGVLRIRILPYKDGVYSLIVSAVGADNKAQLYQCSINASGGAPSPIPEPVKPNPVPTKIAKYVTIVSEESKMLDAANPGVMALASQMSAKGIALSGAFVRGTNVIGIENGKEKVVAGLYGYVAKVGSLPTIVVQDASGNVITQGAFTDANSVILLVSPYSLKSKGK